MAFALVAAPAAWLVQVCSGFALSSWPCLAHDQPRVIPATGFAWTWHAIVFISLSSLALSLVSMWVSGRVLMRTWDGEAGGHLPVLESGSGRTRFLAMWGIILGGAFALATAFTAVAFLILPHCA